MAQSNKPRQGKRTPAYSADNMIAYMVLGLILIAMGVLIFLATTGIMGGTLFEGLKGLCQSIAGLLSIPFAAIPVWGGILALISTQKKPPLRAFLISLLLFVLVATFITLVSNNQLEYFAMNYLATEKKVSGYGQFLGKAFESQFGGGAIGMLLAWPLWALMGCWPSLVLLVLVIVVVFLWLICLDVKGIAAKSKVRREEKRALQEQQQQQLRAQELAWQQEQMRQQQERARYQQEQMRMQQMQQMQQEQLRQQQMQAQQMQARQQQPAWDAMMPEGAANWNDNQGYQQQPVPVVRQVETGRKQQKKPQIGFQPTPEEQGRYVPPQQMPEAEYADEAPARKRKGGLFRRDQDEEPVAISRRRGLFDRSVKEDEPVQPAPRQQTARQQAVRPDDVQDVPDVVYTEEPQIFDEAPQPAQEGFSPEALAAFSAYRQQEEPPKAAAGRKSRKDTPSAWSQQDGETPSATWRSEGEWQTERKSRNERGVRTSSRRQEAKETAARPEVPAAPAKQKPTSSWADTPPWEDSPEYDEIQQPAEAVVPVLTQQRPEGAWEADLKLQPRRQSAQAQLNAPPPTMFDDEPVEVPYVFPTMDLLKAPEAQKGISEEEDAIRSRRLENTLQSFRVPAKVRHITHGPAISRFELELAPGVKVSKVTDLNRNIAMNMEVKSVRIEAPIPGKSLVGVEVPNRERATVTLREVLESEPMRKANKPLVVALGKDIAGTPIVCDLAKMPHLLIAGATGSGKSVCINTIINSLLYRCSPKEVRLILVDPKVVELQCYNGIPHLLIPVVSDPHKASGALAWAVGEMMDRYKRFQEAGVRAIDGYNEQMPEGEKMPRIVIVIDELADLMMTCKKDVEERICRLAQLARAAGIHLIVATQRPSVDVITGLIKANIPSRIAFKVSSNVDSRTILDRIGAEQLLGYGDMLYMPTGEFTPIRVQGCFLSDPEVNRITDFIRENCPSDYDPAVLEELERLQAESDATPMPDMSGGDDYVAGDGSLLTQCVEMAVNDGQVSTSLIQRRLKLGYARAGRLVDEMERRGIVSQKDGAKPRMCLISREEFEAMKACGELE